MKCCFKSSFPDIGVVSWHISRRKFILFPVTKILLASLLGNAILLEGKLKPHRTTEEKNIRT